MKKITTKEDVYKERIIDIVRRYQSGCLNCYVKEAIDENLNKIPVCQHETEPRWKCLDADELAMIYVYSRTYDSWRGVRVACVDNSLAVMGYSLSKWFSVCKKVGCRGLNIPVQGKPENKLKCESFFKPLFLIAHFTHNLYRGQITQNPDKELEEQRVRLANPFLFYISALQVNTLVFGYYALFKALLGKYVAEYKSTSGVSAKSYWETKEWKGFKKETTELRNFWSSSEPPNRLFFSTYFCRAKENEQTSGIWHNLHNFVNNCDTNFKNPRRQEQLKKEKKIVERVTGFFLNAEVLMRDAVDKEKECEKILRTIEEYIAEIFLNIEE